MRFFKKFEPRQQLLLSSGQWFSFQPAGDHGIVATDDAELVRQFQIAMQAQRGGISEITEAEYQDLKKNPKLSQRNGPEKISPKLLRSLQDRRVVAGPVAAETGQAFQNITEPFKTSDYRPVSVKRA
jgi:hypothetical protein